MAVLLPFAIHGSAVVLGHLADGRQWRPAVRSPESIIGIAFLCILLVPFEEIGWRGYLLPSLQQTHTALTSSLAVACVWAAWHLPLAWAVVGHQRSDHPWWYMLRFTVTIVPVSLLATWFFNRTGESVVIASVLHVSFNVADFSIALPAGAGTRVSWLSAAIAAVVAAAVWRRR